MINRWGFITFLVFCAFFAAFVEGDASGVTSNKGIVSISVDSNNIESELITLIKSNNYTYKKKIERNYEMYFDTPELLFFKENIFLRYYAQEYFSKKKKQKYHEKIQFLTTSGNKLVYKVKHYKHVASHRGKHPLIGMVQRKLRQNLFNDLKTNGVVYPLRLKLIFNVSKIVKSYQIFDKNIKLGTLVVENNELSCLDNVIVFNEIKIVPGDSTSGLTNPYLFKNELEKKYKISFKTNNDYVLIFKEMEEQIHFLKLRLKYQYLEHLFHSIIIFIIGIILIKLFFWRRIVK